MADTLRLANFHTAFSARGPGLILQDITREEDHVAASLDVITAAAPDILALQDFDYDAEGHAAAALQQALAARGLPLPYRLALRPNSGWPTGFDLDGDGRTDGPRDAHGYGRFNGAGGMVLLSRYPLGRVQDFSGILWRDLPDSAAPALLTPEALGSVRLHSVGAWDVEVLSPNGSLHILMSHATTPVFDGPEDRNGRRNADEVRFWTLYLGGWTPPGFQPLRTPVFAYMGTLNVDPQRGEGIPQPVIELLASPLMTDPAPRGPEGLATTNWERPDPGPLRVDYILPSRNLTVLDSGMIWPQTGPLADILDQASDHRLIWVDIRF